MVNLVFKINKLLIQNIFLELLLVKEKINYGVQGGVVYFSLRFKLIKIIIRL
jgi:hypothetical protein